MCKCLNLSIRIMKTQLLLSIFFYILSILPSPPNCLTQHHFQKQKLREISSTEYHFPELDNSLRQGSVQWWEHSGKTPNTSYHDPGERPVRRPQ